MTVVRKFRVKSRLARVAFAGGGMRVKEALEGAEQVMNDARADFQPKLDTELERVCKLVGERSLTPEDFEEFYRSCSLLIEHSWCAGCDGFIQAAYSLCDLVDRCSEAHEWDWPGLDVHMSALRLLRDNGAALSEEHQAAVLDGLRKVNLRLAAPGRPPEG
jgi:hypothetical protein